MSNMYETLYIDNIKSLQEAAAVDQLSPGTLINGGVVVNRFIDQWITVDGRQVETTVLTIRKILGAKEIDRLVV